MNEQPINYFDLVYMYENGNLVIDKTKYWTKRSAELRGKQLFTAKGNILVVQVREVERICDSELSGVATIERVVSQLDRKVGVWHEV